MTSGSQALQLHGLSNLSVEEYLDLRLREEGFAEDEAEELKRFILSTINPELRALL